MDTQSQHLIVDLVLKNNISDQDIKTIKELIEKNFTVVNRVEHKFTPHGETIVFILAESHFTLHTYPEHNYISMDIYVCNPEINLEKVLIDIKNALSIKSVESKILERGRITQEEQRFHLKLLYFLTVVVAMGSILYELLRAQSLSTIMGNTALRYNVTIGIYIAAMGFGALAYKRIIKEQNLISEFLKVELLLSFIGGLAPIMVLTFDYFANRSASALNLSYHSSIIQVPIFSFNHFLIFVVGFISGLELPVLMNIGKKISSNNKGNVVLAFDYLGTLVGAILFPLVLLPSYNIFLIGFLVSFLNVVVSFVIASTMQKQNKKWLFVCSVILLSWLVLIFTNQDIFNFMINKFYFGGKF